MTPHIDVNEIDKKLIDNGWTFVGPVLHYPDAWKDQGSVYVKDKHYIVAGIDASGEGELHKPIPEKEAKKRVTESLKEIRRLMFKHD